MKDTDIELINKISHMLFYTIFKITSKAFENGVFYTIFFKKKFLIKIMRFIFILKIKYSKSRNYQNNYNFS